MLLADPRYAAWALRQSDPTVPKLMNFRYFLRRLSDIGRKIRREQGLKEAERKVTRLEASEEMAVEVAEEGKRVVRESQRRKYNAKRYNGQT